MLPKSIIAITILYKSQVSVILNGVNPKYSSKARTPIAQRSTFSLYKLPWIISGDKYRGVPQKVFLRVSPEYTDHPKSHNFTTP